MTKIQRRNFLKAAGIGVGTATIAGCMGGEDPEGDIVVDEDGDPEQESLDVLLTYFPDMVFSPILAADEFGYFEEVGLDVNVQFTLAENQLQLLAQGEYDIVLDNAVGYLVAQAQGIPVHAVNTTVAQSPLAYASLGDSGITGVDDWPGNILGLQNEGDRNWFTAEILDRAGLSSEEQDDIDETFIGYSIENLMTGSVDIMSLYPTNSDYNSLRLAGEEFNLVESREYVNAPANCSIARRGFAVENPNTLREYARAHARGMQDAFDESMEDDLIDLVLDRLNDADADVFVGDVDGSEVQASNFEQFLDYRGIPEWDENGNGWMKPEDYLEVQEMGISVGAIEEEAALSEDEIVDNSFVETVHDGGELIW